MRSVVSHVGAGRTAEAIRAAARLSLLARGEADLSDRAVCVLGEGLDEAGEQGEEAGGGRGAEALRMGVELQPQALARRHGQHQRVIGALVGGELGKARPVPVGAQGRVDRIVLEHHQRVEQGPARMAGQTLQARQRHLLVGAHRKVGLLKRPQIGADRHVGPWRYDHRQRVDEQPQHVLGTGQIGRTPRHRRPEAEAVLPGQRPQQQGPGPLDQRVDRHLPCLGEGDQTRARRRIERE